MHEFGQNLSHPGAHPETLGPPKAMLMEERCLFGRQSDGEKAGGGKGRIQLNPQFEQSK